MTEYKLPDTNATLAFGGTQWEPEWVSSEDAYTADQMQQAYQAGRESIDGLVSTVGTLLAVIDSGLVDITPDLVAVMRVREQLEELK